MSKGGPVKPPITISTISDLPPGLGQDHHLALRGAIKCFTHFQRRESITWPTCFTGMSH